MGYASRSRTSTRPASGRQVVSFGDRPAGDHADRVPPRSLFPGLLASLGLLLLACDGGGGGADEVAPLQAVQLIGPTCAPVGAATQLQIDATFGTKRSAAFHVVSVGCAPSCTAVVDEGNVITIRSDLEGAATVQAIVTIDEGAKPAPALTTARVVQFVGSGSCGATDGGTE